VRGKSVRAQPQQGHRRLQPSAQSASARTSPGLTSRRRLQTSGALRGDGNRPRSTPGCIRHKSDAAQFVRETILLWEKQTGKVAQVRSDGVGVNDALDGWYADHGIQPENTAPPLQL
jgi:hypothetical protein